MIHAAHLHLLQCFSPLQSQAKNQITKQSGLLDFLKQLSECERPKLGDGVKVHKGFLIREGIEGLGLNLYKPPFAPGAGKMSAEM